MRRYSAIPLDTPVNADPLDPTRNPGAAGYLTNPTDLAHLVFALQKNKLLSESMLAQMLTEQVTAEGKTTNRGLSWIVGPRNGEKNCLRLFGSDWSGSSAMMVLPDRKFAVFISTNMEFELPVSLARDLARLWGFMMQEEAE